jgi:hypothetical protein
MIEERFIFPILGERMPQFKAEHLESHKGIHDGEYFDLFLIYLSSLDCLNAGLDRLKTLLSKYGSNPSSYSPTEMRACLDSWREVLFRHLDEEVRCLFPSSCDVINASDDLLEHVWIGRGSASGQPEEVLDPG